MLRISIKDVDNGYVITKYKPDSPGITEESRVAIDAADLFDQLAVILDISLDDAVRAKQIIPVKLPID